MPHWLVWIASALLVVMLVKAVVTVALASKYHRSRTWLAEGHDRTTPSVRVIVPAYNEAATIGNCMRSLVSQTYPNMDVLVVDDGSDDGTSEATELAVQQIRAGLGGGVPREQARADVRGPGRHRSQRGVVRRQPRHEAAPSIRIFIGRTDNGGKASALNLGLSGTDAEIIVCVDADSVLAPDAIMELAHAFADPTVGAVGGIVKVAETGTILGRHQAMEYIAGLSLQRAAFAHLDAVQVLSGAISAFRGDVLRSIGGYSSDTIVEDFDLTVAVQAAGYRAVLHPTAVAYTEGTASLSDLVKQRYRWTYGGFQVLGKYRKSLFTGDIGSLSRVGLPYFMIFPWVDVFVSLMSLLVVVAATATGHLMAFVVYLLAMSVPALALNLYALHLAKEPRRLSFYGFLQALFYAHVLTFATAKAGLGYLRGQVATWEKLERTGLNVLVDRTQELTT